MVSLPLDPHTGGPRFLAYGCAQTWSFGCAGGLLPPTRVGRLWPLRGRHRQRSGSTPGLCRGRRLGGILVRHEQRRFTTGSPCGGLSA